MQAAIAASRRHADVGEQLEERHLRMMWQWHLWVELELDVSERSRLIVPIQLWWLLRAAAAVSDVRSSEFQYKVEQAVVALDIDTPLTSVEFETADLFAI